MTLDLPTHAHARKSRFVTLLVAVTAFVLAMPQMAFAGVDPTAEETANVQGIVYGAVHLSTGRTIIGGSFTGVGSHPTKNVGAVLPSGGADTGFTVNTDGIVHAVAANQDESVVYIGGTFSQVNGVPRANLAAVNALTGEVIGTWSADTNGAVRAMAVHRDVLYVGGAFNTLDGEQKGRLVSLDASGTMRLGWFPRPDWTVRDLALSADGSKVYASGGFNRIGNQPRDSAAELLASTGQATAFSPDTNTDSGLAIDVTPDGSKLFFSSPNNEVYAFDLVPGTPGARAWTTKGGGDTQAIEATDTEVFIGGHFRNITTWKVKRNMVASLEVATGQVTEWNPHISGDMGPWVIQHTKDKLIVGGDFGWVNRKTRAGIARFPVS